MDVCTLLKGKYSLASTSMLLTKHATGLSRVYGQVGEDIVTSILLGSRAIFVFNQPHFEDATLHVLFAGVMLREDNIVFKI